MSISAKQVAQEFGCDARTLRKFLRSVLPKEDQPGQGKRYSFEKKELKKLRKQFDAWVKPAKSIDDLEDEAIHDAQVEAGVEAQDEIDRTTGEVDEPTDEELLDLEEEVEFIEDLDEL